MILQVVLLFRGANLVLVFSSVDWDQCLGWWWVQCWCQVEEFLRCVDKFGRLGKDDLQSLGI